MGQSAHLPGWGIPQTTYLYFHDGRNRAGLHLSILLPMPNMRSPAFYLTWRFLMIVFCQEVRKFVSACEAVHAKLAEGDTLTRDEKDVIELTAIELLSRIKPK